MNDHRQTALAMAAEKGNTTVTRTLLEHGADTNVISITGKTAYSYAVPNACTSDKEMKDLTMVRSYLRELPVKRVEWTDFVEQIQAAANPVEAAHVFLRLAYSGDHTGKNVFASEPDGSKRISKHDRLRLREQIEEAREQSEEE